MVGERLTLADVSVALNLLPAFQYILDTETRKGIVNVTRWFLTVVNNPAVKEVVGTVTLVEKTVEFDGLFKIIYKKNYSFKKLKIKLIFYKVYLKNIFVFNYLYFIETMYKKFQTKCSLTKKGFLIIQKNFN